MPFKYVKLLILGFPPFTTIFDPVTSSQTEEVNIVVTLRSIPSNRTNQEGPRPQAEVDQG